MDPKQIIPVIDAKLGIYPLTPAHRAAARRLALLHALALLLEVTPAELLVILLPPKPEHHSRT